MKKLRYAIVGAGMMGREHIQNISLLQHIEVSLIVDPDETMRIKAHELAVKLGHKSVKLSHSLDNLPVADLADCVVVASPNHLHIDNLRVLLASDLPLLVEKPLCTSEADLAEVQMLTAQRKAPVWVAMEYRYMPPTAQFCNRISTGAVGSLKMLTIKEHRYPFLEKVGDWNRFSRNTGGTLVEKCCHYFDLMALICHSEPLRIYASGAVDVNHLEERYDGQVPDIIDNAFAIVDFDNGMRASLDLCMFAEGAEPQETITAVGTGGKLEVRIPGPDRFWPGSAERCAELVYMAREPVPPVYEPVPVEKSLLAAGDHHGATFYQHEKFAAMVRTGGKPEVGIADGIRAVRMGLAAEQSIKSGQAVTCKGW